MTGKDILQKLKTYPIAVAALLIGLIALGLLNLRGGKIEVLRQERDAKEKEYSVIQTNLRRSSNLGDQLELIREYNERIRSRVMDADEIAINYDYFFRIETETGVRLINISQLSATATPDASHLSKFAEFSVIPYNISVQGTYAQVLRFLEALETGRHLMRIDSVSYSRTGGSSRVVEQAGSAQITAALKLYVLGRKEA